MTIKPIKALIMAHAEPCSNPRPRRIIELLKKQGYIVHVASFAVENEQELNLDGHYVIRRPSLKFHHKVLRKLIGILALILPAESFSSYLNELRWGYKNLKERLGDQDFDIIIVEDIYLLGFALKVKGEAKVIFDAREFYPEELGNSLFWRLTERPARVRACKRYLKQCDAVMTVSSGLVERYEQDFGVKPFLLRSMPAYQDLLPGPVQGHRIRVVHHGVANRDRRLENMILIMNKLDNRFELDIYLTGTTAYIDELRTLAAGNPKINFRMPVPFKEIIPMLNQYDMGFCYLEPTTFNLEHCLPNKFFEFIQARLAIISGPSPDMVPFIKEFGCGVVSPEFNIDVTAKLLNSLTTSEIEAAKLSSHAAASILCYERESLAVLHKIDELLARSN